MFRWEKEEEAEIEVSDFVRFRIFENYREKKSKWIYKESESSVFRKKTRRQKKLE